LRILRLNVREPNQVIGDFFSLAACNDVGHKRLMELLNEVGYENLNTLGDFILSRTHAATMERIAGLPKGSWSNDMLTDGYDEPIRLAAEVSITDEGVNVDFSGTDGMSRWGINVPLIYTKAYASYALKCVVAPDIPNNAASLAVFNVSSPTNILNAERPAPVSVRHVIGHMVPDLVLGALAK